MTKGPEPERADRVTARACQRKYGGYSNVVGVSVGSKFSNGERRPGTKCVQFFVSRKLPEGEVRDRLPREVHPRAADGSEDGRTRIQTDVIELRNLRLCCGAGSKVARVGGNGAVTLMFRDRTPGSSAVYAVSCSHVLSDLITPRPSNAVVVGGTDDCLFVGDVVGGTVMAGGTLPYDIGLIEVRNPDTAFDYLGVAGRPTPIARLATATDIRIDDEYDCAFPVSGTTRATVESLATTLSGVQAGGSTITLQNLVAATGRAQPGDSGGLLFSGDRAVGILVAQADGDWLFFQPLADALAHLQTEIGVSFRVFDDPS